MNKLKEYPKVSIIILNYNGLSDTIKCLESLKNITYPNYNVIVVDNNSNGNDADYLEENYGNWVQIVRNSKNYGYAEGNNIGIRIAQKNKPDYILILNNDVIVDPLFLDELVQAAENDAKVGIAGPKQYYMDNPEILYSAGGKILPFWGLTRQIGNGKKGGNRYNQLMEVDVITGACWLIRNGVIEKIGYIPTDYFLQWEDIDYCTNVRRHGYKCLYVPKAIIWHKVGAFNMRSTQRYHSVERGFRNRIKYFKKYLSSYQFALFLFWQVIFLMPLFSIYYIFFHKDIKKVKFMLAGIKNGLVETYPFNKML